MDLRNYSDEQLLESTWQLACADRRLVTALLHHLNEIALRRLYAKESYPSLFAYCQRALKFTEAQTQMRICGARMLKDFPQIEAPLASGALSLTAVTKIYRLFRQKEFPPEEKNRILKSVENKSKPEVEKIVLAAADKKFHYVEKISSISETLTEYRFAADTELVRKLERLKNVLKLNSLQQLVGKMADVTLQKYDPIKKAERNLNSTTRRTASVPEQVNPTRHIPAHVRHTVWLRDKGICTFPDCGSQYGLELDHIILFAHGGQHTVENLRLRCMAHNQLHALNVLGEKKMSEHWRS